MIPIKFSTKIMIDIELFGIIKATHFRQLAS